MCSRQEREKRTGKIGQREDLKGRTERISKRAQSAVKEGRKVNKKWARCGGRDVRDGVRMRRQWDD